MIFLQINDNMFLIDICDSYLFWVMIVVNLIGINDLINIKDDIFPAI